MKNQQERWTLIDYYDIALSSSVNDTILKRKKNEIIHAIKIYKCKRTS